MSRRYASFPNGLSHGATVELWDFVFQLASAGESHHLVQLRRHHDRQRYLYDPEDPGAPWPR